VKLLDPDEKFPLTAVIGIRHHAQWGGTSTNPGIGKQPQSIKNLVRIFLGASGGEDATLSDQINVLGNHYGSYDFRFGYINPAFDIHLYKQHYYEDRSGMEFDNYPDGLYGIQVDIPKFSPLNQVVMELLYTRHQSGTVHYIPNTPIRGRGRDNYYNNGGYPTGVSYFNRAIGTPIVTSPEYNENRSFGFRNNLVRAFHAGFQGMLSKYVSYRLLASASEGWGTMGRPFIKKESNYMFAIKTIYCHPRLESWIFSGEIATDFGPTYGNNTGMSLSVKRIWKL
jgi:hypothetical protein